MNEKKFSSLYNRHASEPFCCDGDSRTHQSFKDECDINNILNRYARTGVLPQMIKSNPRYGDFATVQSYQDACNVVLLAQEQFNALDANVRDRFNNDPSKFLAFCSDEKNKAEMISLGLAVDKKLKIDEPSSIPIVEKKPEVKP